MTKKTLQVKEHFYIADLSNQREDIIWREKISSLLTNINNNIIDICYYGVTEMINNAIDHSESADLSIFLTRTAKKIKINIVDSGVGIFNKIRSAYHLHDSIEAFFELSKGKLTTDQVHHTGQGIFFTSRMFERFEIYSENLLYVHTMDENGQWFQQEKKEYLRGTSIFMEIGLDAKHTITEVFDKYTTIDEDDIPQFTRTRVDVHLIRYGSEQLLSRSQAKCVVANLEKYSEIILNFKGITQIGQAFADEIFRVFQKKYPKISIKTINTTKKIDQMIKYSQKV